MIRSLTRSTINNEVWYQSILAGNMAYSPPKISGGTVFQDATYIYHLIDSSGNIQVLQSITNMLIIVVGGGASGTYPGSSSLGAGGSGGGYNFGTTNISPGTYTVTIGAGGGYSFNSNSISGTSSSFSGVSASGGSGANAGSGSNGVNGVNTHSSTVLAIKGYWGADTEAYRGVADQGYLAGGGAGATNSTTGTLGGLGGGGRGFYNGGSPYSGLYAAGGGGGGGGGIPGYGSAAGPNGGSGVVILRYLK